MACLLLLINLVATRVPDDNAGFPALVSAPTNAGRLFGPFNDGMRVAE